MTALPAENLVRLLRNAPGGMTAAELAQRVGRPKESVSSQLYKLVLAGRLRREIEATNYAPGRGDVRRFRYLAKEAEPAAWLPNIASPPT